MLCVQVKLLFAAERKLCDQIWFRLDPHREKCFADVTDSSLHMLLSFGEAIAKSKKTPEKLFVLLDMYETMRDLQPEVSSIFLCFLLFYWSRLLCAGLLPTVLMLLFMCRSSTIIYLSHYLFSVADWGCLCRWGSYRHAGCRHRSNKEVGPNCKRHICRFWGCCWQRFNKVGGSWRDCSYAYQLCHQLCQILIGVSSNPVLFTNIQLKSCDTNEIIPRLPGLPKKYSICNGTWIGYLRKCIKIWYCYLLEPIGSHYFQMALDNMAVYLMLLTQWTLLCCYSWWSLYFIYSLFRGVFDSSYQNTLNELFSEGEMEERSPSYLASATMRIMQVLQSNLEGKAKLYKDPAISHLFLMNNIHYMVKSVRRYAFQPGVTLMLSWHVWDVCLKVFCRKSDNLTWC